MIRRTSRRAIVLAAAGLLIAASARAQTACATSGAGLKSFSPVDSLILNPSATSFSIKLYNSVSGCPTEYRVSRYSDFHDATWTSYSAVPTTIVQRAWFPPVVNGTAKINLYFQVRAKNPQGGLPTSLNGGTQPMFYVSSVIAHSIRIMYVG